MLRLFLNLVAAPALLLASPAFAGAPDTLTTGMVSAADPRAAQAGAAMLRQGGSAADAAIATMLALTVVEPQSSGIGGGGFFLHSAPDGQMDMLDGREAAPAAATPDWFLRPDGKPLPYMQAVQSGLSVGVPGNIHLAAQAHQRHGRLKWKALFQPAIVLARDGFVLTQRLHEFLERSRERAGASAEGQVLFYTAAGDPLPVGTRIRNPALAKTLEQIAKGGTKAFYGGANARAIAVHVAAETPRPAGMTVADLAAYRAKSRAPLCGQYRVYRICGMGPPSSGATTVLAILGQLERFDMRALGPDSPVAWHLFAESQRLAYADRELYAADADFVPVPASGMVDPAYLATRSALIAPDRTMVTAQAGTPPGAPPLALADGDEPAENGTSHFVAVDRFGSAVTYTSTIEGSFGSGLMVGGYYLNNELTDFSMAPVRDGRPVANRVQGGKRPRSSMAPTLVYGPDGKLVIALGAAGGGTIPVQVARALIGMVDWQMPVDAALALPVLFAPVDAVTVEQGSRLEAMIPALIALGHAKVTAGRLPIKTNAISLSGPVATGAADPRSEGLVVTE